MNCRKVNHLLSAYADGELPGVEHRQIHTHLVYCHECRSEYESLVHMKRLLAGLRLQTPRVEFSEQIRRRLAHERSKTQSDRLDPHSVQSTFHWRHAIRWNPLALQIVGVGAGLTLMATLTSYRNTLSQPTSPSSYPIVWSHVSKNDQSLTPPLSGYITGLEQPARVDYSRSEGQRTRQHLPLFMSSPLEGLFPRQENAPFDLVDLKSYR